MRYQILLSCLLTLFAFSLGLYVQSNLNNIDALYSAIGLVAIILFVYLKFEGEFRNREADINTTYRSVNAIKKLLNKRKS